MMRGSVVAAALSAVLWLAGGTADATAEHPCAKVAAEQARQLLLFHFGPDGLVEIDQTVTAVAPIRNPANPKQAVAWMKRSEIQGNTPRTKTPDFAARPGKNMGLAGELMYDSAHDGSHIQVRREPGAGDASAAAD